MSSGFNKLISDKISEFDKKLSDPSLTEEERFHINMLKKIFWEHRRREALENSEELKCPYCTQKLDKPFLGCKYCGWTLDIEYPVEKKRVDKKLAVRREYQAIRRKYQAMRRLMERDKNRNPVLLNFLREMERLLMNQIDIEKKLDEFLKLSESIVKNQEDINRNMESILDTIIDNLGGYKGE